MREIPVGEVRTLFWDILDDLAADLGSDDSSPDWTPPVSDSEDSDEFSL